MDGLDLSVIDKIDQDVFNCSPADSEDDEPELPTPDCIGIDSAVQDEEELRLRLEGAKQIVKKKTKSEIERELELKVLKPDSIRRQILEQSMNDANKSPGREKGPPVTSCDQSNASRSHVMNIVEKAGMHGIDKEKINEIIHEASRGSLFYKKQAQRQAEIHKSIERMLNKVKAATPLQVTNAKITCDRMIEELEKQRLFNKIIVHFDLDMFFAAVEIRDNPELADKPVAVGGDSMISTSNYIARRFGVRAAMPGFIARKLCPDLILIKPNGIKYRQSSAEVFSILEQYDPELTGMSLDEAYLDLTDYVKNSLERDGHEIQEYYNGTLPKIWWSRANEIVEEIRASIYSATKLTCSAGIACNTLLAKISTDINKPNGQFMVEGYPSDINDFIGKTPVSKVSGIGKVSSQFLSALKIETCGDIYEKRHYLPLVFYEINVKFYLRVALGDGSTCIKSDEHRKSKSVERTFTAVKDPLILLDKLDSICDELCMKYLKPYRIRGRTITIKLKRNTFTTTTKSYSMLVPTNDKLVIYSAAKNLLISEIANEPPEISYRLLGVKLSNLADDGVNTNQLTIDALLRNQELSKSRTSDSKVAGQDNGKAESRVENEDGLDNVESTISEKGLNPAQNLADVADSDKKKTATKRIEDFFSAKLDKTFYDSPPDCPMEEALSNQTDSPDTSVKDGSSPNGLDTICEFDEASRTERPPNQPNHEDYHCPYCFKTSPDFVSLEAHVEKCSLKISIDVNKSLYSQRPTVRPLNSSTDSHGSAKSEGKFTVLRQSAKKVKRKRNSEDMKSVSPSASSFDQYLSTQPSSSWNIGKKAKTSFYQKFIESNSQRLSQSPRVEPMQCPYCMHGFLSFESLENHVIMCAKNTAGQ